MNELKSSVVALAGVAQWTEHEPENQRVDQRVGGSIPGHGTGPGYIWIPGRRVLERQPHIDVSLPLFLLLSSPLSKNE